MLPIKQGFFSKTLMTNSKTIFLKVTLISCADDLTHLEPLLIWFGLSKRKKIFEEKSSEWKKPELDTSTRFQYMAIRDGVQKMSTRRGERGGLEEWMSTLHQDLQKYNFDKKQTHLKNQSGAVTINGQVDGAV